MPRVRQEIARNDFYNENDPAAAEWLRELIKDGLIPKGVVDERSIKDVRASDLAGYRQCHFFAGIGGWPLALRLAGWSDARNLWTGSCPCQPYSAAGKGLGDDDPRNLWPDFFRLIRECRPECVIGEQVESAIRHGWLDGVCSDLEREGYACGSVVLGAHSVGAPHIRQRLFWVADQLAHATDANGRLGIGGTEAGIGAGGERRRRDAAGGPSGADPERLGDAESRGCGQQPQDREPVDGLVDTGLAGLEGHAGDGDGSGQPGRLGTDTTRSTPPASGVAGTVDNTGGERQRVSGAETSQTGPTDAGSIGDGQLSDGLARSGRVDWSDARIIVCRDGKARLVPAEPLLFPLADGIPGRVGLLRGAGNAICPQAAAELIQAYREIRGV